MKRLIIVLVLSVFVLSACAAAKTVESPAADYAGGAPVSEESARQSLSYDTANTGSSITTNERIVIKNANLSIVVVDPGGAMTSITRMAEGMGGFVVDSNLYKAYTSDGIEVPAAYLTIRVPSEQLDAALTQIKALVEDAKTDILSENVSGQDVTMEYTDLQSRLRNLEAAEEQLTSFMDKATKIEEVMQVYNQLNQVRSDIEVLKGQIKYYDESARLSAITVNLTAKESIKPVEIAGWKPVGIARNAVQALIDGLKVIGTILIWVIIFVLPIALIIGLPTWLIIRAVRRNKAKQKAIAESTPAAEPYQKLK